MTGTTQTKSTQRSSQATTEEFLSGKLAQVDIKRIESELKSLWDSAAKSDKDRSPVTRACVMNLILYTDHPEAEKTVSDLLGDIILHHPCRAILAIARDSAPRNLEAWVSARCHKADDKSQRQICCEQITVRGQSVSSKELASAVMPMVLADLPVFMWFNAEQFTFDKVQPFLSSIDRFIVDSAVNDNNLQFFTDLLLVMNATGGHTGEPPVVCSDLNWRRSIPWREAIALAFDTRHSELSPAYLSGITSVDIRYGGDKSSAIGLTNQALLIVGWLASTLGWRLQKAEKGDNGKIELSFDSSGNKIAVNLIAVATDEAAVGDIGSIQVHTNKPDDATLVALQLPGMPGIGVTCSRDANSQKAQPNGANLFEVHEAPEGQLIDKELENLAAEPVFKRSVASTVEILNLLTGSGGKTQRR